MAVMSKRQEDAQRFQAQVNHFRNIMDHGPITWFLGVQIKRDREAKTILINQHAFKLMAKKFILTSVSSWQITEGKVMSELTELPVGGQSW